MKKWLIVSLALVMAAVLLSACNTEMSITDDVDNATEQTTVVEEPDATQATEDSTDAVTTTTKE